MAAILELTFTDVGVVDETFDYTGGGDTFTFKATRRKNNQVTVATDIAAQAKEFYNAFLLDYNRVGTYTVSYTETTLTLEHPTNTHFDSFVDATHNNTSFITTAKSTTTEKNTVTVTPTFTAHTSDKCNKVACNLTFNVTINELTLTQIASAQDVPDVEVYSSASFDNTTIDVVLDRDKFILQIDTKIDGFDEETRSINTPYYLTIRDLIVNENAAGGAVQIDTDPNMIGYADNTYAVSSGVSDESPDFQSSNTFYQLVPGSYLAHVKDDYGCERTEAFTISDEATNQYLVPPNIAISQKVSVPFLQRDLLSTALTANQYQFLPSERPDRGHTAENWEAVYAEGQNVAFQWLSSYPDHNFKIVPCSGFDSEQEEITLSETQYSDNINRDTYLEGAVYYNSTYERLAVSFSPGDVYDSSGDVIGSHTFDDVLPNYYEEGILLIIDGEAMTITDIITDSGKEYAITDSHTNNPQASAIIQSVHEAQQYEVFGVSVDMSAYTDTTFYLKLEALSTTGSVAKTFQSYKVKVISDEAFSAGKWHYCRFYSATSDDEMIYSSNYPTSYRHKNTRNIPYYDYLTPVSNSEIETKKLDNEVVKIDFDSMEVYESNFEWMPLEYAKTLAKCFNDSDIIEIDNVSYTSISAAEIERKGHWGRVKVQLASNGSTATVNTFIPSSSPGYYPVVL